MEANILSSIFFDVEPLTVSSEEIFRVLGIQVAINSLQFITTAIEIFVLRSADHVNRKLGVLLRTESGGVSELQISDLTLQVGH